MNLAQSIDELGPDDVGPIRVRLTREVH